MIVSTLQKIGVFRISKLEVSYYSLDYFYVKESRDLERANLYR
jgi:hypothetical protein